MPRKKSIFALKYQLHNLKKQQTTANKKQTLTEFALLCSKQEISETTQKESFETIEFMKKNFASGNQRNLHLIIVETIENI